MYGVTQLRYQRLTEKKETNKYFVSWTDNSLEKTRIWAQLNTVFELSTLSIIMALNNFAVIFAMIYHS